MGSELVYFRYSVNEKELCPVKKKTPTMNSISPLTASMVWKAWAPPKLKFFAWLALQDRIWTADRLEKRGWPNCGPCPLCKREQEMGIHLFVKCLTRLGSGDQSSRGLGSRT